MRNGPTETALDSLNTDITKKTISQELKHISTSTFREGLLGKRGVTFFREGGKGVTFFREGGEGCNFHAKKIQSEIFNGKKKFTSKKIIFCHN